MNIYIPFASLCRWTCYLFSQPHLFNSSYGKHHKVYFKPNALLNCPYISISLANSKLESVSLVQQISGYELGLFHVWGNEYQLLKRWIKNHFLFATAIVVHLNQCILKFGRQNIFQCKIKIWMSICHICPSLMVLDFKIMFNKTPLLHGSAALLTCCEESST